MIFKSYMQPIRDPLDIHLRIRDICPSWRLFYNKRKARYEVHDIFSGQWNTLVSVLPYTEIDQRTIKYLSTHKVQNFGKILREIEYNNADLVREQMRRASFTLEKKLRQTK